MACSNLSAALSLLQDLSNPKDNAAAAEACAQLPLCWYKFLILPPQIEVTNVNETFALSHKDGPLYGMKPHDRVVDTMKFPILFQDLDVE
jgi:hypothetical protein